MIDTLHYSEEFKKAGFDAKQSKVLAHKLAETNEQIINSSIEKEQLTKKDIKQIEKEIVDIKLSIEKTKSGILQWMITVFAGQTAIIIGAFFAITKLSS